MSTTYAPGTVAVATVRGVPNVRVFRSGRGWQDSEAWSGDSGVTDVRPLVVLDPEDEEQIDRLLTQINDDRCNGRVTDSTLAYSLRHFNVPPKPAEPTGLGAVVEDAEGRSWVRTSSKVLPWYGTPHVDDPNCFGQVRYVDIDAVRVLSEGVTA